MKYTYTVSIEKETEIKIPLYFKLTNGIIPDSYFAILKEDLAISNWMGKDITYHNHPSVIAKHLSNPEFVELTAEEFKEAMDDSLETIKALYHS
jgi:hypothetical protein